MALSLIYDSQEAIPEPLRGEFHQREDRKWVPKEIVGDVPGWVPKARHDEFRENNTALQNKLRELQATVEQYKDLDPAKAREALQKLKDLDQRRLMDEGQYEKALEAAKAAMQEDAEAKIKAATGEREQLQSQNSKLMEELFSLSVDRDVRGVWAIPELGLRPTAVNDALDAARLAFRRDDRGQLVPHDYNGTFGARDQVIYGPKGEPATAREWVERMLPHRPHWKIESTGVGDLGNPAGGGLKGEDLMKLSPVERMNRARSSRAA